MSKILARFCLLSGAAVIIGCWAKDPWAGLAAGAVLFTIDTWVLSLSKGGDS